MTEIAFGACPAPLSRYERIVLGHGSGGRLTSELVRELFLPAFPSPVLAALEDQATVAAGGARIAITTDSFVVRPLFFPGGDIGTLAVNGSVNDLAVGGARPLYLAAAFILEEGLPVADLRRVVESMRRACDEAEVALIAGDTKVVDHGKGDGIFITTTAVGVAPEARTLSIAAARPGDALIVSGTLGDHGVAILSVREGIEFETPLSSDCAPLTGVAAAVLGASRNVRCMRDPTRGGLSSALNELAEASRVGVEIEESAIPLKAEVRSACEMLGLDPLYVACEGRLVAAVAAEDAARVLDAIRAHPLGREAAVVGRVVADHPGIVTVRSSVGGERVLPLLSGEQLPRIC
jgi:hydrogenase expression/formation protein HypE